MGAPGTSIKMLPDDGKLYRRELYIMHRDLYKIYTLMTSIHLNNVYDFKFKSFSIQYAGYVYKCSHLMCVLVHQHFPFFYSSLLLF